MVVAKISWHHQTLHEKSYFLFPNVLKRWSFQKTCTGIWSFLYYQERWYFFSPKISSYSLDGKWKMIFLKKIHGNIMFSSNVLKRWSFQKNHTGIWSFLLHYLERWYFIFPKIWYYSLDRKWKMIFLKKIHVNSGIFFKCPEKMFFPENIALEYDLSCIIWKDDIFFKNLWYFFFGRKMNGNLSQEIYGKMIFSVYMYKCYKYDITLLHKKIKDDLHSKKYT